MKIVLASNNRGKLTELQALLADLGVELIPQSALGIAEAQEPFHTFLENALAKARHASAQSGLPAIADDAGLCVDAFGGKPGVQTAYYATWFGLEKGDANNVKALLEQLQTHPRGIGVDGETSKNFISGSYYFYDHGGSGRLVKSFYTNNQLLSTPLFQAISPVKQTAQPEYFTVMIDVIFANVLLNRVIRRGSW